MSYPCWKDRKKFCSKECQYSYYTGERHYSYRGGCKELIKIRDSYKWREWKKHIYERDNHTCQICGVSGKHIHHIYPIRGFPEMTYDDDNAVILCIPCHNKYEGIEYIGLFDIIMEYNDKNNSTE
jgi:5-methylcytosine-specific restriction endonuclease McrA